MVLYTMTGRQAGFAYLALLTVIAASLISLSVAMPDLYQSAKREREAQLIFAGLQYQQALKLFYEYPNASIERYPVSLDELMQDNRGLKPIYHLRRLYRDPMTKSGEWALILNEQQQIIGVHSYSNAPLLKTHISSPGVIIENTGNTATYADLKFIYQPNQN